MNFFELINITTRRKTKWNKRNKKPVNEIVKGSSTTFSFQIKLITEWMVLLKLIIYIVDSWSFITPTNSIWYGRPWEHVSHNKCNVFHFLIVIVVICYCCSPVYVPNIHLVSLGLWFQFIYLWIHSSLSHKIGKKTFLFWT